MVSGEPFFKSLKGVRAKGRAVLYRTDQASGREQAVDREDGEIQFTEEGLSGSAFSI
jgi:predicted lipoprotein with Yx(FWY)xxD motif